MTLGDNCHIGVGAAIFGGYGFVAEDQVALSPGAKVFTATTDVDADCLAYHSEATFKQKPKTGSVHIKCQTAIGANSVVLPGVTIGEQVQVGALSVVNRSLESHGVYVGAPARFLKPRARLNG